MIRTYFVEFCVLLSVVIVGSTSNSGKYLIYAPNYIRINEPYQLSISTFNVSDYLELNVVLEGFYYKRQVVKVNKSVRLRGHKTQIVKLDHSSFQSEPFTLRLKSMTTPEINRNISLNLMPKKYTIMLQTDQQIYKPGDTVKFRILILDQTTKPVSNLDTIRVEIKQYNNIIKTWPSAKLHNGIFQSQFEIAESKLGNYSLVAIVNGKEYSRKFVVGEYKLPQHEIRITCPNVATFDGGILTIDVDAWYTFGKPIKGEITVTAGNDQKIATKFNGRLRSTFRIKNVIGIDENNEVNLVHVEVSIRDLHTKRNIKASETVQIFRKRSKVTLKQSSNHLVPGHLYQCWLLFTDPFGKPINNLFTQIKLNVSYVGKSKLPDTNGLLLTPDINGVVPLVLSIPEDATRAELIVFGDGIYEQFLLDSGELQAPGFFQVSLLTESPAVGYPVSVQVQASNPLDFVVYQVVARKQIVYAKRIDTSGDKSITFKVDVTPDMLPTSKISVFSVRDGRMLSDSVDIAVNQIMNSVKATVSGEQASPSDSFTLNIDTLPNSMVGILAIDKAALLLDSGNQITKKTIYDELLGFPGEDELYRKEEKVDDLTVITNLGQSIGISERFGSYDSEQKDNRIKPRKIFPHSWLWNKLVNSGPYGNVTILDMIPDTITNWEIAVFSINPTYGLGVLETPLKLQVTKPLFVMLNLPHSIKMSETTAIEISVFNYLDKSCNVKVTLENHRQEFEFVFMFLYWKGSRRDAGHQSKNLVLMPNSAKTVSFLVKAKKVGDIMIKVVAESDADSDSAMRFLRVMPESKLFEKFEVRFVEFRDENQSLKISIDIPKRIDPGTENISLKVDGDLLKNAADDFENMIQMPSGSGQQNILKMVPNVVVLDYKNVTNAFDKQVKARALSFLELGYQNQLKFRRDDGSFNEMGNEDPTSSVFLTALVAKTLKHASRFITVNESIIEKAYDWLKEKQCMDGTFSELGDLTSRELQKTHSDVDTLTAYVMIAFLEDESIANKFRSVIQKGTDYLATKLVNMKSMYTLSMIAYCLQLANHNRKSSAFDEIIIHDKCSWDTLSHWCDAGPNSLEATSYVLLTYLQRGYYYATLRIVRWLNKNQYNYSSTLENTQTTFVSLQALATYAKIMSPRRNNYYVSITCYKSPRFLSTENFTLHINPQSSKTLQSLILPPETRSVELSASGTGHGIISINYNFYYNFKFLRPRFEVEISTLNTSTTKYMHFRICVKYANDVAYYSRSALTLMEITFPSGYIAMDETVQKLESSSVINKVVTKHNGTMLVLYFENTIHIDQYLCENVIGGLQNAEDIQLAPGMVAVYELRDKAWVTIKYFDGAWSKV